MPLQNKKRTGRNHFETAIQKGEIQIAAAR